jgi:uncharacterized tellurite resistance protein B-like protein
VANVFAGLGEHSLEEQQARDFLVLLCRVAWADGAVTTAERAMLVRLRQEVAPRAVTSEELLAWLQVGPPAIAAPLPLQAKTAFHEAALSLVNGDGTTEPHKMRTIRDILQEDFRSAKHHP